MNTFVLIIYVTADEFQLKSKGAYIPKCINILWLFPKSKQKKSARPK